jgi:predicted metalloprotease with PDZ domain
MGKGSLRGSIEDTRETFYHEMTHLWVGQMDGDPGVIAWFAEGLTVYYTLLLPLRGELVPVDEYATRLNKEARDYYESPARNWSAARIAEVGFGDERIRHTPYVRGALYFSNLDFQIRRKSRGKRNLDTFLNPMFVSRRLGARFDQAAWEEMLTRELGAQAVTEFRSELIDGNQTVTVASEAFGPCFRRESVPMKSNGQDVQGYQWARIASVSETRCRKW